MCHGETDEELYSLKIEIGLIRHDHSTIVFGQGIGKVLLGELGESLGERKRSLSLLLALLDIEQFADELGRNCSLTGSLLL